MPPIYIRGMQRYTYVLQGQLSTVKWNLVLHTEEIDMVIGALQIVSIISTLKGNAKKGIR